MQSGHPPRQIADLIDSVAFPEEAWPALEMYRSLPVPVRTYRGAELAFLFGNETVVASQGRWIGAPSRAAFVDPLTAAVTEVRRLTNAEFGRPTPDPAFARRVAPLTAADIRDRPRFERLLYDAYDVLLPAFASKRTQLTPAERRAAEAYRTAFPAIAEPQLRPYYDGMSKSFTEWLTSVH